MEEAFEVEVQSVTKQYGKVTAADAVTLGIKRGEFLTMLGPSGCGKTTVLRMIAGFETPDSGRVILSGRDVTEVPPYKRNVTTVFQHYALFPHLTVFENVAFGLERRRVTRAEVERRVQAALDMVRLSGFEDRQPSALSGGQQQRVALARALVLEPKVLLLDEPLAALDLKLRKQMQTELKALQQRLGISFVFVTHDQEEALTMSDRIVVMNAGRIEQIGEPQEIYERPRTQFVAGFIGDSNILDCLVEAVDEAGARLKLQRSTFTVTERELQVNERVKVLIRPEKVRLTPEATAGGLAATITSAIYQGESTVWKIGLDEGQELTALEQNRESAASWQKQVGQTIFVSWLPASAIVLRG